jgi:Domain of Unknown Function (DUF748)
MKEVAQRVRTRWQKLSRVTQIVVISLLVLLVALRLALPFIVKNYVNRQLARMPDYKGAISDVDIHLWRGAYTIRNLRLDKTSGAVPVPFVAAPTIDLSVQWKELFHGSVVGEVTVERPHINFVAGPTEEQSQKGMKKGWDQILENLFPFKINKFQVDDGDIRFRDFSKKPNVDIFAHHVYGTATNLSNARTVVAQLPAGLRAHGKTIGDGEFDVHLRMNPMSEKPTFKLAAAVTNMNLVALNDFLRAYGKFDVERGNFSVYSEVTAAEGHYEGYIKPLFEHLDVFEWEKERGKNILEKFWEAIVAGVAQVFKNHSKDRLATVIPIKGNFEKTDVDIWATVGGVLKNAFIRALLPKFDNPLTVDQVKQKAEKDKASGKDKKADQSDPADRMPHLPHIEKKTKPPTPEPDGESTSISRSNSALRAQATKAPIQSDR